MGRLLLSLGSLVILLEHCLVLVIVITDLVIMEDEDQLEVQAQVVVVEGVEVVTDQITVLEGRTI